MVAVREPIPTGALRPHNAAITRARSLRVACMALFGSLSDLPGLPLSTDALKGAQQWREGVGRKARLKTQIQPVLKKCRRFDISNQNRHHNDALLDLTQHGRLNLELPPLPGKMSPLSIANPGA